jgi:hypothetical protein
MGMSKEQRYAKIEMRGAQYVRNWKTDLMGTTFAAPGCECCLGGAGLGCAGLGLGCQWLQSALAHAHAQAPATRMMLMPHPPALTRPALPARLPAVCCLSVFCPCCVSYHLRKRVLRGDVSRYLCCNGDWPCSGRCGEQSAPEFCLGLEVGGWLCGRCWVGDRS